MTIVCLSGLTQHDQHPDDAEGQMPVFEPVSLAQQALNGLSFGALLFLLASGLTLVFGLQRIVDVDIDLVAGHGRNARW